MAEAFIELERKDPKKTIFLKEAVKTLEQAYEYALARRGDETADSIVKEIDIKLKRARKMLYLKQQSTEDPKKEELSKFVKQMIERHEKDDDQKKEYLELFEEYRNEKRKKDRAIEIPDFLNCKISYVRYLIKEMRV